MMNELITYKMRLNKNCKHCVKFPVLTTFSVRVNVFAAGNNCVLQEAPTSTRPQFTPSIATQKKKKRPTNKYMQTNKRRETKTLNFSIKSKIEYR